MIPSRAQLRQGLSSMRQRQRPWSHFRRLRNEAQKIIDAILSLDLPKLPIRARRQRFRGRSDATCYVSATTNKKT